MSNKKTKQWHQTKSGQNTIEIAAVTVIALVIISGTAGNGIFVSLRDLLVLAITVALRLMVSAVVLSAVSAGIYWACKWRGNDSLVAPVLARIGNAARDKVRSIKAEAASTPTEA